MFILPNSDTMIILEGEYSPWIVLLSVVIACLASYTALSLNERIQQNSFFSRNFWLTLASIAMGMGIWSMHFIGMSAFMLPVSMDYDIIQTIISVFPAVLASYLAFYFSNQKNKTQLSYVIAGITMGLGIASMHYIGMSAMKMDAKFVYKPWTFLTSVVIAIIVSYVALYIFSTMRRFTRNMAVKMITSIIMGLAVASMHYTGMSAVVFYSETPLIEHANHAHSMNLPLLILFIAVGISIFLALSGLSSILDRYVDYRLNYYDALTLLPNRRQFEKKLEMSFTYGSLAIIHLDSIEKWNSGYGYAFGDKIIKEVGQRIIQHKPEMAEAYRIEGNRFALLITEYHHYEQFRESLAKIMNELMQPIKISDHKFIIDMVCALSTGNREIETKQLFLNATAVLQHSSIEYKHEVIEYDPNIHIFSFERSIIQDIDKAMDNHELFIVYQPKIGSNKAIIGAEALLRWNHPTQGFISPAVFIPALEENGKITDVTDWIIEQVCHEMGNWIVNHYPLKAVSINIPGQYITSPRLMDVLKNSVSKYKIDSHFLELEITETSVINNIENAISSIGEFRKYGFRVALDDFGTGLSSLSYLKRLPITTVKIDKSFVDGVPESEKDSAIIKAIIVLCHSLNMDVIIEGVETEAQVNFLSQMPEKPGIQGYYYSPPLKREDLAKWVRHFQEQQETMSQK
ncbi:bifunctional diguanylate cyclase/phosphodiesterase [Metabacillus halosaccharovorans]|uniref:bifunctional diguanylate cyclase/phosphodiesterase n=1 Tax=Metabacillus halosaccharovorans TaxID=930124 RepID=UPI001C200EC8|nr:EAL domain-containing protein [Metabacillus halosaccharovorans]MBU7595625.1 EAL domain-containing protein [Metabacillus halosaccharovorans]